MRISRRQFIVGAAATVASAAIPCAQSASDGYQISAAELAELRDWTIRTASSSRARRWRTEVVA